MKRHGRLGFKIEVAANGLRFPIDSDDRRLNRVYTLYRSGLGNGNNPVFKSLMEEYWTVIFHKKAEELQKSYEESEEALQEKQRREDALKADLETLKTLEKGDHVAVLRWIASFTQNADYTSVQSLYYKEIVALDLEKLGYVDNWLASAETCKATPEHMANYLAGQVINCLRKGLSPPPALRVFVAQFFEFLDTMEKKPYLFDN